MLERCRILVVCEGWDGVVWRDEPRWNLSEIFRARGWCLSERPKRGIYNGPKNDQNDQNALWNMKGRTAAVGIFTVAQPRQAWRISIASLPRLVNRGTSTAATLSGFCCLLAACAQPRLFNRDTLIKAPRLSIIAQFAPRASLEPKHPCYQNIPQKPQLNR